MTRRTRWTDRFEVGGYEFGPVDVQDADPTSVTFLMSDVDGPIGWVGLDVRGTARGELRPLHGPGRTRECPGPTIATLAMLWLGLERLGLDSVWASIHRDDERTIRACEAAGFVESSSTEDADHVRYLAERMARQSGAHWDEPGVAASIAAHWTHREEQLHRAWLAGEVLRDLPGGSAEILEVGCGSGLVYAALAAADSDASWRYQGIDRSYQMLARAVRGYPSVAFRIADLFALSSSMADVIVCCEVLGHLPDFQRALEVLVRGARRRLVVSFWIGESHTSDEQIAGATFPHHVHSPSEIHAALRRSLPDARIHETHRNGVGLFSVDTSLR